MLSRNDFVAKQIILLVPKDGEKLAFKNDNVIIYDKNGKVKHQSTCYRLFAIFIFGHISLTTGIIQKAKKFGFAIVLLTTSFRPYQIISEFANANVILRKNQYEYTGLEAAKLLIENKIINQRDNLKLLRNKSNNQKDAIYNLNIYIDKIKDCDNIQSIMGIEGAASKIYFKNYFNEVEWKGRKPRIKYDMTNALLDIGYTILFCYIDAVAELYGFDTYNGFLHRQFYMRKSLICDLVEPFRVIIDHCARKGINLKRFKEEDFEIFNGSWQLKYVKSSEYASIFMEAILEYKEEIFIYIQTVYRCFMKKSLKSDFPCWRYQQ